MGSFSAKSITDPLYGSIGLSELEADVVSTKVFQRLHNVRQLGLAHLVFPSAGYSRFSHSIGACHNAGRLLDAIVANSSERISADRRQAYRLAALLHDVGHYPFSHATEHAVQDFYAARLFESEHPEEGLPELRSQPVDDEASIGLDHEDAGKILILKDPSLARVFGKHGYDVSDLLRVFSKSDPDALTGIISSELDCDRLDYLRRTAHLSGAPYGAVDTHFIISKATVDEDGILCFQDKATMAIDHLLVSRFYDYMTLVYHKTVAALEWSLQECVRHLLARGRLNLTEAAVARLVEKDEWWSFDDNGLLVEFKNEEAELGDAAGNQVIIDHMAAVLYRRPAKMVWHWENIARAEDLQIGSFKALATHAVSTVSSEMGIERARFHIADVDFPLSKIERTSGKSVMTYGEQARAVSILSQGKKKSVLLVDRRECLLHQLAGLNRGAIKVFYLPRAGEKKEVRQDIRNRIEAICEAA